MFGRLRRAGVLGMNARNQEVISRWNPRRHYPRVDDKLLAKQYARRAGIPVPALLGEIEAYGEVRRLRALVPEDGCAVKPVRGSGGNGVLVLGARDGERLARTDGSAVTFAELEYHVAGILAGLYSLAGRVDRAMVEERLRVDPRLEQVSSGGVPDVRIVVYRGVPVMAMTRLPTRESRGRANLHQGAMAAGVDLASGRTSGGMHHGRRLDRHPDTGVAVAGLVLPHWDACLEIAARSADAFELGYLGVDLVLDARHGAMMLEANARPGLAIQLANGAGLLPRLAAVDAASPEKMGVSDRVALGRRLS